MVSMKPGSGTEGLDLDWDDEESDQSQTRDARLVPEGSERDGRRGGVLGAGVGGDSSSGRVETDAEEALEVRGWRRWR